MFSRLAKVFGGRRKASPIDNIATLHKLQSLFQQQAKITEPKVSFKSFNDQDRVINSSRRHSDISSVDIILLNNSGCCEALPKSVIDEAEENEKIWLIPRREQVESIVKKNVVKRGTLVIDLFDSMWTARIIVKDGMIIDVKMEKNSVIYQGKAAIAMINSLSGPANLKVYKLKDKVLEDDPLSSFFIDRRSRKLKGISKIRQEVIELVNKTYNSIFDAEEMCSNLLRLKATLEKLFSLEDKVIAKKLSDDASALGHKFEHAAIIKSLSELSSEACNHMSVDESFLTKFLRLIDDLKLHFSRRDIEIYRNL
jgi:hypothetical protein